MAFEQKIGMKLMAFLLFIIGFSFKSHCKPMYLKKIDIKETTPLVDIPVDIYSPKVTTKQVSQFIPMDLTPTNNSGLIATRIADKSLQYWINNSSIQNSPLLREAKNLQDTMKADLVLPTSDPDEVKHKFSLQYEIFQSLTKLQYKGWMDATVNYNSRSSQTDVFVQRPILNNKKLFLNQKFKSAQSLSMMGVMWSF